VIELSILREEIFVSPVGSLDMLSRAEVGKLKDAGLGGMHETFRSCALAVLNCGGDMDDARAIYEAYQDFEVDLLQQERGIRLRLRNAPASAFVDGKLILGIRDHLFSVLRDVVYVSTEFDGRVGLDTPGGITEAVFHILRNARVMRPRVGPNLVVCWGGHAIGRAEYDYSKVVGYEFGLRGLDVCTGCGPGAMKGPMKGAAVGHAKQRIGDGRYVGISEPGIIAAEAPNPIVNELVIMPDIEKRLEAFIRLGHGFVIFPGGVGTAEEILYLLGVLLHPDNASQPLPMVMTGPASAEPYFRQIDRFVGQTLGPEAQKRYSIIIDDPAEVAREMSRGLEAVHEFRKHHGDAYYFNWRLVIDRKFQAPFTATHESMSALDIREGAKPHELAANLRRAFSGIVSGNVRDDTAAAIEEHGPFEINGSARIMTLLDDLLASFVEQRRMKIAAGSYRPCYRVLS